MEGNITTKTTISGGLSAEENMRGELSPVGSIKGNITLPPYIPTGSNDYNDLNNLPKINVVELKGNKSSEDLGLADRDHTHTTRDITNFPNLANVATSGDYGDLTNKPTIPTNTSDLNNDSGFVTTDENVKQTAGSPSSYSYWRPITVGARSSANEGFTPSTATGSTFVFSTLQVQPSTGIIRMGGASFFSGSYTSKMTPATLTANRTVTIPNKSGTMAMTSDIPAKVSDLTNDSGFLTLADLPIYNGGVQ